MNEHDQWQDGRDTIKNPESIHMARETRFMVTLSRFGLTELEALANAKGEPLAKLASRIIEQHIESPAFGNLLKRALERAATYGPDDLDTAGDDEGSDRP